MMKSKSKIGMLEKPKDVIDNWLRVPEDVEIAVFLDGRKFINPKNLQQLLKAIKDSKKRK